MDICGQSFFWQGDHPLANEHQAARIDYLFSRQFRLGAGDVLYETTRTQLWVAVAIVVPFTKLQARTFFSLFMVEF